jgi:cytochrome P450
MTQKLGYSLVERKKRELQALHNASIEKPSKAGGKDLLSILVKANIAADLPPAQRLSDQELIDQVSTLLLAGSETTSTGLGWTLYNLARSPDVQERARR